MSENVVVGTRGSELALLQADEVIATLRDVNPSIKFEKKIVKTTGDKSDKPLRCIGGKGLFLKELEICLSDGSVDIAVHSVKDVPGDMGEEFVIPCVLKREDCRDALISRENILLDDLPDYSVIGTCAPRRCIQLNAINKRLNVVDMRGNVNTRLKAVFSGKF